MNTAFIRTGVRVALGGLSLLLAATAAVAQGFPERSLRYVVPYPAGGASDTIARVIAQQISKGLGQPVVVDNRPGANGNMGTEEVVRGPADGYTLLSTSTSVMTINPTLYRNLNYDAGRDLTAVAYVAPVAIVLVVHPSIPARNLTQLLAFLKANSGKVNFSSSGSGTTGHLAGELLKQRVGVDILHVPYKGDAPAFADLVGGHVHMMFATTVTAGPHINSGRLVPIALAGLERDPTLAKIPTMAESGLPGFDAAVWYGVVMKAGTPTEIVSRLHNEINKALQVPEVSKRMTAVGAPPATKTIEQFATLIKEQREKWSKVVRESGARVD